VLERTLEWILQAKISRQSDGFNRTLATEAGTAIEAALRESGFTEDDDIQVIRHQDRQNTI
jgi:hypothetical protein